MIWFISVLAERLNRGQCGIISGALEKNGTYVSGLDNILAAEIISIFKHVNLLAEVLNDVWRWSSAFWCIRKACDVGFPTDLFETGRDVEGYLEGMRDQLTRDRMIFKGMRHEKFLATGIPDNYLLSAHIRSLSESVCFSATHAMVFPWYRPPP
jgi:hypothetical protein